MRQLLAFFILLSFLAQTFSQAFIVADYYINTSAFAKNCENRDKPKLKCNGKCQMMKKLKQEEKKQQQDQGQKTSYKSIIISSKSFFATIEVIHVLPKVLYPLSNTNFPVDRSLDIFHPPQV